MDSEDELGNRDTPFSTSLSQGKSRIADQVARQRKMQKQAGQRKPAVGKTAAKPQPVKITKTAPDAIRKLNRRVDEKIVQIPALALNETNIRRVRWLVGVQTIIILALVMTFAYAIFNLNDKNIYAARSNKPGQEDQVARLTAMNGPTHTQAAILAWATTTATSVMNFGFHNINDRLRAVRPNFTKDGWSAFITAVQDSRLLQNIVEKQQVVTAAPIGAAVIVRTVNLPRQRREWIVQIPFTVTTLSGKQTSAVKRTITMTISDIPATENLAGLGISNWIES